jgi:hypothetical protein
VLSYHPTAPGGWLVGVLGDSLFAVRAEGSATGTVPTAESLLAALATSGIQAALELVTERGLTQTPAFALVRGAGKNSGVRVVVRGGASVVVSTPKGDIVISGDRVDTWLEQSIEQATSYSVDLGGSAARTTDDLLRIDGGAVWADRLTSNGPPVVVESAAAPTVATPTIVPPPTTTTPVAPRVSERTISDATVAAPPDPSDVETINPRAGDYDHLFGATVARNVEAAAVRPAEQDADAEESGPAALDGPSEVSGDHDGLTVMSGDLQKLRAGRGKPPTRVSDPPPSFRLELANGTVEPIDGPLIVGRAPSVSKAPGSEVPRLITVDSVDQDISRSHVRFTLEGDTVVVTDLHSRNGTTVVLPGKTPQKLRQGEPTSVLADTLVDLGSGVTMTVRQGVAAPKN